MQETVQYVALLWFSVLHCGLLQEGKPPMQLRLDLCVPQNCSSFDVRYIAERGIFAEISVNFPAAIS